MEKNSVNRKRTVLMEKIVLWKIVLMENSAYGKSCCQKVVLMENSGYGQTGFVENGVNS